MLKILMQLKRLLTNPKEFFSHAKTETWKSAFIFFLWITLIISIATPIVNLLGIESTDISSSYQAQIIAYNFAKNNLFSTFGPTAYLFEAILIFVFAIFFMFFLTAFLHLIYRLVGGQGSITNAWKITCYGVGPCLLGGFLPYISLFAGFYSFAMQFYIGPRELYEVKESRVIVVFVTMITLTFVEMFVFGTTMGF